MFNQVVALAQSLLKLSGAPSWSSMVQEEEMVAGKGAGEVRGGSGGGYWWLAEERWLVIGWGWGGGVRMQGMEKVAEKLWARVWVASSLSGKGRTRSGSL